MHLRGGREKGEGSERVVSPSGSAREGVPTLPPLHAHEPTGCSLWAAGPQAALPAGGLIHMRGVDVADQLWASYSTQNHMHKW
jgi:hypothetical protein